MTDIRAVDRFDAHSRAALDELDDADRLRDTARAVRAAVQADLPAVLEQFADAILARGGRISWASTAVEARAYITDVVRRHGARRVAKSTSMATEEISLDVALEAVGVEVVESDLGEWIVQLAEETPSHLIAPALRRNRDQVHDLFVSDAGAEASELGTAPEDLMQFARQHLREVFLSADVGITGANLAVAESGSIVLVTNEGNGRLVTALPKVHIVVLGMERMAANWDQADLLLSLLARSATGQRLSSNTSVITGARRSYELDGPDELHVVVLDNGRSRMLGGDHHEMLACIRCGAWLNAAAAQTADLADASTLCGTCMDACPASIPLQDMDLSLRRDKATSARKTEQAAWRLWAAAWSDAQRYSATTRAATWERWAGSLAGKLPPASKGTSGRTLPRPAAERFRDRWRKGLV
jgi:L-lactate dehydrogenase complex protein LldF